MQFKTDDLRGFLAGCLLILCSVPVGAASTPSEALQIVPLSEHAYLHISTKHVNGFGLVESNGLIYLSPAGSVMLDTPWSEKDTAALLDWAAEKGMPITTSFSSHSHEDRTAGIGLLNARGIETYASSKTNAILRLAGKPVARHEISDEVYALTPDIEIFYPGEGHAPDNSVVWIEGDKLLVGGCLIRSAETDTLGYTGDANIAQWGGSVQRVAERYSDAQIVIPGHGEMGDQTMLIHTISLTTK